MLDITNFPKTLIKARRARAWSQKELADKLNMMQSQISDIEAGKRDPRLSTIAEVARAVGLEMVLIPRQLLPAVSFVLQPQSFSEPKDQQAKYEFWHEEEIENG